jgi:hypothetical protein
MSAHDWVVPFDPDDEVDASVASVGGKAANLLELRGAGFAVPDGFVVPADAYREFVELAGIAEELAENQRAISIAELGLIRGHWGYVSAGPLKGVRHRSESG